MASRVMKELEMIFKENNFERDCFAIEHVNDSNLEIIGKIMGPFDSPYDGGVFRVDIQIPNQYPLIPPKCKMITKVWHPNVSSVTGAICLDILKDEWSPAFSISSILLSIQALLSNPNPSDPQDAVVGSQYTKNRELFNRTARYWTNVYAKESGEKTKSLLNDKNGKAMKKRKTESDGTEFKDFDFLLMKVMKEKSVPKDKALESLSCSNWDLEQAYRLL